MNHIDLVTTAKMIRETLKVAFPNTKFSVRSKSYSGGCSIRAEWTDGPAHVQVQPILDRFEGKGFDGMIDLSYYCGKRIYKGEPVDFCGCYVFGSRTISREVVQKVADRVAYDCGVARPVVNEYGSLSHDLPQVPFSWDAHWNTDDNGRPIPLTMADIESSKPLLAHDSHRGEWLPNLITAIAANLSFEQQQPVELPEYIREPAKAAS